MSPWRPDFGDITLPIHSVYAARDFIVFSFIDVTYIRHIHQEADFLKVIEDL